MPAQLIWLTDLDVIREVVRALPRPFVGRATVEALLGVGRRAQQVLAPCVTDRVGTNGVAEREQLITHLQGVAPNEEGRWECQRRHCVAHVLARLRQERMKDPQLPVEAPVAIVNQEWETLPTGVHLAPSRITVEFDQPQEGLEKLLALAMAISNDFEQFERSTRCRECHPQAGRVLPFPALLQGNVSATRELAAGVYGASSTPGKIRTGL
jgi:hypothetical protein